jgi:hypothetical protein
MSSFVQRAEPTVSGAFQRFLERKLAISADTRQQAATSGQHLRETLTKRREKDKTFPRILTSFLSGSFPRHTKNPPLDDIDLMLILDGAGLFAKGDGQTLVDPLDGSADPANPLLDGKYDDEEGGKSSIRVLNTIKAAVDEEYGQSEVVRDGQAVNVRLSSYGLGFDIVPCLHMIPGGSKPDYYLIPKGDGQPGWMATNPKFDADRVDALDKPDRQNGRFRPTTKLLKWWNTERNRARLRPFHLEAMALDIFESYSISTYQDALKHFFTTAPDIVRRPFPDPAGLGPNVDRYLTDERRNLTAEAMAAALGQVREALRHEESGDYEKAISAWRLVLGEDFPA